MTMPIRMIEAVRNCLGDSIRNPPVRIGIETIKHQAQAIKIQNHRKQRIKLALIVLDDSLGLSVQNTLIGRADEVIE